MRDVFLLVGYCRTLVEHLIMKMSRIMSSAIYSLRMLPIIKKNFFHTFNFEITNCTVRQCIYTGGFVPSLFATPFEILIPAGLCKPSCRTLQSKSHCNPFCHN